MTHDDQCEWWDEDGNSTGQPCHCAERALAQAQTAITVGFNIVKGLEDDVEAWKAARQKIVHATEELTEPGGQP